MAWWIKILDQLAIQAYHISFLLAMINEFTFQRYNSPRWRHLIGFVSNIGMY